jgi:hypothetical protein
MSDTPKYSEEEANAILRRAIERSRGGVDALSHEELVAAAKEVGVAAHEIEAAAIEERRAGEERRELARWQDNQRRRLVRHASSWAFVNALCLFINVMTGSPWWFYWVLGPWGLVLALQAFRFRQGPSPEQLERARQRRLRKQRRAELKARIEDGAHVLGDAVGTGVGALVKALEESQGQRRRGLPRHEDDRRDDPRPDPRHDPRHDDDRHDRLGDGDRGRRR